TSCWQSRSATEGERCPSPMPCATRRSITAWSMHSRCAGSCQLPPCPRATTNSFAAFEKFGTVSGSHFVDMTVDQLKLYDSQNVQYVEFMVSSWCPNDRERFVKAVTETTGDASKLAALEASGLGDCVAATRDGMTAATGKVTTALACDARNAQPGCGVTFRYILQINRNNSPDEVFVQTAIAAALIRAEPRIVALNFVGPDGD